MGVTLKQAEEKLIDLREKRKALDREIDDLRYLIADLTDSPLKKDFRERDKKIYLDWERNKLKGKKGWRFKLYEKYNIGSDRLRAIYNEQKELREKKKG